MASAWLPGATDRYAELAAATGLDLPAMADDDETFRRTALAQPAVFATSIAALDSLGAAGITPDVVAGHSLGEVSAASAAGVLTPAEGAALVAERGRAMGAACERSPGVMVAVLRLPLETIEVALVGTPEVRVANHNAPGQTVIAGPAGSIDSVIPRLEDAGGHLRRLPVEGPFHTPAMAAALVAVDRFLQRLPVRDATVPLVTGRSAELLVTGEQVRTALIEGVLAPVRWVDVQRKLVELGVELAIEVGSAGVLAAMARRTVPSLRVVTVASPDDISALLDAPPAAA